MSEQHLNPPDLEDLLKQHKNEIFATMNCIQIGKISSFDTSTQSAQVELQVKRRISGETTIDYPLLIDVPVIVVQGSGAYIEMPINEGDYCLVLFNDRDIDNWWVDEAVKELSFDNIS